MLGLLVAIGGLTIDVYLPALPAMRRDLGVADSAIQLTLSGAMAGFGLGQAAVGPWSDIVGRKLPLVAATAGHVAASIGVALASDLTVLIACRTLQGAGCTAAGVIVIAIVRDLYSGRELVRMLANLAAVTGATPLLAPALGAQLLAWTGWQGLSIVVAAYGALALLLIVVVVRETGPAGLRAGETVVAVTLARYRALLGDRRFVGAVIASAAAWSAMFAYLAAAPFLIEGAYRLDLSGYTLIMTTNSVVVVIASQVTSRLVLRRFGAPAVLLAAAATQLVGAMAVVLAAIGGAGLAGFLATVPVVLAGIGMALPCAQFLTVADHADEAGTAVALAGTASFVTAGAVAPLAGLAGFASAAPLGLVLAGAGAAALVGGVVVIRARVESRPDHG